MPDAVLSRDGTSVTIPILAGGGSLAIARDTGKPTASLPAVGRENPRSQDFQNAGESFVVQGLLSGANAYSGAKTLAEDLIKPRATTNTPLQLDLSALPSHTTYDVAPVTDSALTLTYAPGSKQLVAVQLAVSVVRRTIGGSQTSGSTGTPDAGTGIKLERPGTSESVTLTDDLTVTRTVGRPNGKLQPSPSARPIYIDQNKPAVDEWEISASNVPEADGVALAEDLVRDRLGQESLELHFLGNLLGLDQYDVFPAGSQAVRYTFQAGATGFVNVPTLKLRTVNNS